MDQGQDLAGDQVSRQDASDQARLGVDHRVGARLGDAEAVGSADVDAEHVEPLPDFPCQDARADDRVAGILLLEGEGLLERLVLAPGFGQLVDLAAQLGVLLTQRPVLFAQAHAFAQRFEKAGYLVGRAQQRLLHRLEHRRDGRRQKMQRAARQRGQQNDSHQ